MTRSFRSISLWLGICVSSLPIQAASAADAAKPNVIFILADDLVLGGPLCVRAQPVDQLAAAYLGELSWDQARATVRFSSSGNVHFSKGAARVFIWRIPPEVKQFRIAPGVTVNGAFHSKASVLIAGEPLGSVLDELGKP